MTLIDIRDNLQKLKIKFDNSPWYLHELDGQIYISREDITEQEHNDYDNTLIDELELFDIESIPSVIKALQMLYSVEK